MPKPTYAVFDIDLSVLAAAGELFPIQGSSIEFVKVDATIQVAFGDSSADLIEISEPQQRSFCKPIDGLFIKSTAASGTVQILVSDEIEAAVFSSAASAGAQVRRLFHVQPGDDPNLDTTLRAGQAFGPSQQDGNQSLAIITGQVSNGGQVGTVDRAGLYGFRIFAPTAGTDHVNARLVMGNFGIPVPSYLATAAILAAGQTQKFSLSTTMAPTMVDVAGVAFPASVVFGVGYQNISAVQTKPHEGHFLGFRGTKDSANWEGFVQSSNGGVEVVRATVDLGVPWDGETHDLTLELGYDGTKSFARFLIDGVQKGEILQLAAEVSNQAGIGWSLSIGCHKKGQTDSLELFCGHRYGIYLDHQIGA